MQRQPLNLWAWRDRAQEFHLGISEGPSPVAVDLAAWDPALTSVEAIWRRHQREGHGDWAWLGQALSDEPRVQVELSRVTMEFTLTLDELWAAGVTYEQSREARTRESQGGEDFYRKVYDAKRPELFFKAPGSRVVGPDAVMGLRPDSGWTVPEPELTVILDPSGEIFGYTAGNDLSARDIEGENPLYLPQAKMFHHGAALGPSIALRDSLIPTQLDIQLTVFRGGMVVLDDRTHTSRMRRSLPELVQYLTTAWPLARWTGLMTGTGIVPPDDFSLQPGDEICVAITGIGTLRNAVRTIHPAWVDLPRPRSS